MQIVSNGDNLHEMSNPVFWEIKKNISKCRLLKFLLRVLSVNKFVHLANCMPFVMEKTTFVTFCLIS